MRRIALAILLLASTAPLAAAEPDRQADRRAAESERRSEARAERAVRSERVERADSPFQRVMRAERAERAAERSERADRRAERVESESPVAQPVERREQRNRWGSPDAGTANAGQPGAGGWRWRDRNAGRARRAGDVPPPAPAPVLGEALPDPRNAPVANRSDRRIGDVLRDRVAAEGWRRDWRRDQRYDWRRHRDRDRARFRLGIYIDPFGWNYRRWDVGYDLYPRYYSSRYWIDPFYYSLPPVYGPYRWVRYWNDALLVDVRTGRVVDVIHGVFW